ncbi:MAG: hypothetical protein A2W65_00670 [Candidatus Taylorbacteria bacterium RIFCSPLOWO2_02_50_13]|nr:MAG: hypothetical protein A2W65_00670 [Candidatus Taylorbacteria bacterium RIFCSPLOWO2_02_50_13]
MTMHDFLVNIQKEAAKTRLSPREKSAIRKAVLTAISASPRPLHATSGTFALASIWRSLWLLPRALPASLALVLLVGVGTAFAAEGALPGDFLYPIKISVNEKVLTAVALLPKAKASAETRILERRLEEAAELEARGGLSSEASAELSRRFDEGAERLAETLEQMEERGELGLAVPVLERISVGMASRAAVLGRIAREEPEQGQESSSEGNSKHITAEAKRVSNVAKRLRESLEETLVAEARATAAVPVAAKSQIDSVEARIKHVRSLREKNSARIKDDVAREVEETLRRAEEQTRDARERLEAGDADAVFSRVLESRGETEEAHQQIEAEVRAQALLDKYANRRGGDGREDNAGVLRVELNTKFKNLRPLEAEERESDDIRVRTNDDAHNADGEENEEDDTPEDNNLRRRGRQ